MTARVIITGCVECGRHTDNRDHVCDRCRPLYDEQEGSPAPCPTTTRMKALYEARKGNGL